MSLSLQPVTKADVPRIVDIFWEAMKASAFFRATGDIPNPDGKPDDTMDVSSRREMQIARYLDNWNADPTMHLLKVVDEGTGEVIAFARWHTFLDEAGLEEWRNATRMGEQTRVPLGANEAGFRYTWGHLYEKRKEFFGENGRPHCRMSWPYHIPKTHPPHHRRGAGTLLVDWGCKIADEHGLECYLEASKTGYPLYRREGFREAFGEDTSVITFDVGQFTGRGGGNGDWVSLTAMVRPPKSQ